MSFFWRLWLIRIFAGMVCSWTLIALALPQSVLGDRLQIALPVVGAACAAGQGNVAEFALRLGGTLAVVHGLKFGLGNASINQRPNGHGAGFPSGHTAAAAYGASAIARDCAGVVPYVGPAVILAAGFVGGSRVQAGQHSLGQVTFGALIGLVFDLGLRCAAGRARVAGAVRRRRRAWAWRARRLNRFGRGLFARAQLRYQE